MAKIKKCPVCSTGVEGNSKCCPECGYDLKGKPFYKSRVFCLIVVVAIFLIADMFFIDLRSVSEEAQMAKTMSESEFKSSCMEYDYDDLTDSGEYMGEAITVSIEVEGGNLVRLGKARFLDKRHLRSYTIDEYGYHIDEYSLKDIRKKQEPKLYRWKRFNVYGIYAGTEEARRTYHTDNGGSKTETVDLPIIEVLYVEPVE